MQNEEIIASRNSGFYETVSMKSYPDGMPVSSRPIYAADTLVVRPRNLQSFVAAMFLADALAERGNRVSRLVLPFIPGARQDRLNDEGDYLFTLKSVAKMINDRGFDKVTVVDPHSPVATALIDRCVIYPMTHFWTRFNQNHQGRVTPHGYDAVIAPDAGGAKRALDAATVLGVPLLQAEKHRDVATGKLSGFACAGIEKDKHYLIVDDICDGGGTFIGLYDSAIAPFATADLFVTHGIFSAGTAGLLSRFNRVLTTDTTVFDKGSAQVIPILERLS